LNDDIRITSLVACLLCAMSSVGVHAQSYPRKAIRLVVPLGPGGGVDASSRLVGDKLAETLGQRVVIDNCIPRK